MPDMPQDPRQLARDILSGKISIEDLAREQARRRGQVTGATPPSAPRFVPPRTVPPARQAPAPRPVPPLMERPTNMQAPSKSKNMPAAIPIPRRAEPIRRAPLDRKPASQQQRTIPMQRQPQQAVRVKQTAIPRAAVAAAPSMPQYSTPDTMAQTQATKDRHTNSLKSFLADKTSARRGIILAEVLGKPLALRDT